MTGLWDILCAFHKCMKIRTKACYDIMGRALIIGGLIKSLLVTLL